MTLSLKTRFRIRRWGGRLLLLYFAICVAAIIISLNGLYPAASHRLAYALRDPAMDLTQPFTSCAAAHAAGFYNIPSRSKAYVESQDKDGDGLACEPYSASGPWRFVGPRRFLRRLTAI
jgi:Excalibur calcium-binding domain